MPSLSSPGCPHTVLLMAMGWLGRGSSSEAVCVWGGVTLVRVISPPWMSWEEQVRARLALAAFPMPLTMMDKPLMDRVGYRRGLVSS